MHSSRRTRQDEIEELLETISTLIYRRYDGDISRVFTAFNTNRNSYLSFHELLDGLSRVLSFNAEPQLLWEALSLEETNGKMTLSAFAQYFGTTEEDLSNQVNWSSHQAAKTPKQDERISNAAFNNLKRAQSRNINRREEITSDELDSMECGETIAEILNTLESTELTARKLFQELDAGSNKRLDSEELRAALNVLGLPVTSRQTSAVVQMFDRDGDNMLKYSEFLRLVAFVQSQRDIDGGEEEASSSASAAPPANSYYASKYADESKPERKIKQAARCSAARKQREEVARVVGLPSINPLDYKLLEEISNGVYSSRRKVRHLFKMMDRDGDKRLNAEELSNGLKECRVNIDSAHAQALVNHFGQNGSLKYSQFMRMLASSSK
mgnify:CR=1 FL=1